MTSDFASSKLKAIPHVFRELLLLEKVQRSVEGRTDAEQARMREVADAIDARIDAPSAVERPTLASIVTAQPWPAAWLWIAGAAPAVTLSPMTNTRLGVSPKAVAG